jgi:hypothetical protein
MNNWHLWQLKKNQNLGGCFGATSLTALPIWPIWLNSEGWIDCLAGSSKTAQRILIFSIVLGAEYSFYVNSIATLVCTYLFG